MTDWYLYEFNGPNEAKIRTNIDKLIFSGNDRYYPQRNEPYVCCYAEDVCMGDYNYSYWKHIQLDAWHMPNTVDFIEIKFDTWVYIGRADPTGEYGILDTDYDQARGSIAFSGYYLGDAVNGHEYFRTSGTVELLESGTWCTLGIIEQSPPSFVRSKIAVVQELVGAPETKLMLMRYANVYFRLTYVDGTTEEYSFPLYNYRSPIRSDYFPIPFAKEEYLYIDNSTHYGYKVEDSNISLPYDATILLSGTELDYIETADGKFATISVTTGTFSHFRFVYNPKNLRTSAIRIYVVRDGGDEAKVYINDKGNWVEQATIEVGSNDIKFKVYADKYEPNTFQLGLTIRGDVTPGTLRLDLIQNEGVIFHANVLALEAIKDVLPSYITVYDVNRNTIHPTITGTPRSNYNSIYRLHTLGVYESTDTSIPSIDRNYLIDHATIPTYQVRGTINKVDIPSLSQGQQVRFLFNIWSLEDLEPGIYKFYFEYPAGCKLVANASFDDGNPIWIDIEDFTVTSNDSYWGKTRPAWRIELAEVCPHTFYKNRFLCAKWR